MSQLAPPAALEAAADALAELRASYLERYGAAIFEVAVTAAEGSLHLTGHVLLPAQRDAALAAVRARLGEDVRLRDDLIVLTLREEAEGWFVPAAAVMDILRQPAGELSTQVLPGDPPIRWLAAWDDWWAVELADGTVGWLRPDEARPLAATVPESVLAWHRDWAGEVRPGGEADFRQGLADWWGVPYVWGGCTPVGVDCSGLTQRVYKHVVGLGLPKHSRDQLQLGVRVTPDQLGTGDLVGLRHLGRHIGHVGIVLATEPLTLAHASLEQGVTEEPLEEVLTRYQFRAGRRFVASTEARP